MKTNKEVQDLRINKKSLKNTKEELIELYGANELAVTIADIKSVYINSPEFQDMDKHDQNCPLRLLMYLEDYFWNTAYLKSYKEKRSVKIAS